MTRQEQRALLILVIIITVGLSVHYFRSKPDERVEVITTDKSHSSDEPVSEINVTSGKSSGEAPEPHLININREEMEGLCALRGIGPAKAEAIINYREENGIFRKKEQLLDVHGIGPATLSGIRDEITLGSPPPEMKSGATFKENSAPAQKDPRNLSAAADYDQDNERININTANLEALKTLDNIGEIKAERIINYRKTYGDFRRAVDITKVKGIGEKTFQKNMHRITVGR